MDVGLEGKVAIVAASSKGLGKASALAREGARVTICARTEADLEAAAEEIRGETRAEVLTVPADLAKPEDIQNVVAATVRQFGGVDVLVDNSGGPALGRFPRPHRRRLAAGIRGRHAELRAHRPRGRAAQCARSSGAVSSESNRVP